MSTTYGWDVEPTPTGNQPPPPEIGPAPPARTGPRQLLAAAIAICLIGLLAGLGIGWSLARSHALNTASTGPSASSQAPITTVPQTGGDQSSAAQSSGPLNLQALAAKVDPVVVDINTEVVSASGSGSAAGTGIILTSSGQVLTNNHVVEGATSISVSIAGRSNVYTAQVVGVDPSADVALLQVEGVSGLPTAALADSSTLSIGEAIAAFGNARGAGGTPSASQGSIVALDQAITAGDANSSEQLTGMIEINADIAAGESGGPIVNSAGQVLGMITAGQSQGLRTSTATIGYAIPSSTALGVVNQIRSGQASSGIILGQVGYLGVQVADLNSRTASRLGLSSTSGALVIGVAAGSPAAAAGLSRYAVITAAAGALVDTSAALGTALHSHRPGDRVEVTWVDSAGTHTASITLASGPAV